MPQKVLETGFDPGTPEDGEPDWPSGLEGPERVRAPLLCRLREWGPTGQKCVILCGCGE